MLDSQNVFLYSGKQEYSQRALFMMGSVIMAIIIPLALLMCLLYFWCWHKPRSEGKSGFRFEDIPRAKSASRLNLRSASMGNLTDTLKSSTLRSEDSDVKPKIDSPTEEEPIISKTATTRMAPPPPLPATNVQDGDSSGIGYPESTKSDKSEKSNIKKLAELTRYDKTYRTNEPLPNAPDVEFPEKLWDLTEEDLISLTSPSDSGSNRDSTLTRPAKDIQYINKPRQKGRHNLTSDSGYSTKDNSEDPYGPRFGSQYSPIPSNYSPTYSEIYSPPLSPIPDFSGAKGYNNPGLPETPRSAPHEIKTFTLPPKRGKSQETLIDPPFDPKADTFSGKTTMV